VESSSRTLVCSVLFLDIVEYSKKPVAEQLELKQAFNRALATALEQVPQRDRIILDTGDGAAVTFMGDPEDALFAALAVRNMASDGMPVRLGVNLGPVRLVKDLNGQMNIIGDGINVAQRIMSFARPGQIVVSRSYYDVVSNLASEYAKLFHYEGSRTDKHVREHEIYVVGHHEGALQKAKDGMKDRATSTSPNPRKASTAATGSQTVTLSIPAFVNDKKKLSMIAGGLLLLVAILGVAVLMKKPPPAEVAAATAPATETHKPAEPPKAAEPAKTATPPAEPVKTAEAPKTETTKSPDSKVLEPAPSPSQIPAPAPTSTPGKDASKDVKKEGEKAAKDKAAADAATSKGETKPGEAPKAGAVPPATVFLDIKPWGEIYVNGRSQGVSPPKKFIKLDPGKYKIEFRNTTFPAHTENVDVKARDEITLRHRFQ